MNINWDPRFSPIWQWLASHSGAILAAVLGAPSIFAAAGLSPDTIQHVQAVAGVLTTLGVIGQQYAPDAPVAAAPANVGGAK